MSGKVSNHSFVQASAGTGKTHNIVEKVAELVQAGTSLSRIVIITFTEKAAGELKERIRKKLHSSELEEAKADLATTNIGTIHSFCRTLLKKSPPGSGLSSTYTEIRDMEDVLDGFFNRFFFQIEWKHVSSGTQEELIRLLETISFSELKDFANQVLKLTWDKKLKYPELEKIQNALVDQTRDLIKTLEEIGIENFHKAEMHELRMKIQKAQGSEIYKTFQILGIFTGKNTIDGRKFKKFQADESLNEKVQIHLSEIQNLGVLFDNFPMVIKIISILNEYKLFYSEQQIKKDILSTDEIILKTRDLLVQNSGHFQNHMDYEWLIIDECQDTDPIQYSLFEQIRKINPKIHIYLVGDKKQSIYKFRNSDVKGLNSFLKNLGDYEKKILDKSYRSTPQLMMVLNTIFDGKLIPNHLEYEEVSSALEEKGNLEHYPALLYSEFPDSDEKVKARNILDFSASSIADCIQKIVHNENYKIIIKNSENEKREIRYSDIAVLAYKKADLKYLLDVLKKNQIPASIYKEKTFYENKVICALAYLLHCIENPFDSSSLYKTLISDLFLISDSLLYEFLQAEDLSYNNILPPGEKFSELGKIFESFQKAHRERYHYPASFLISRIFEEHQILPRLSSGFEGKRNLANYYLFLEILNTKQFEEESGFGQIARELKNNVENSIPAEEKLDFDENYKEEDSVKLITVHSSKGLEFPVCMFHKFAGSKQKKLPGVFITENEKNLMNPEITIEFSLSSISTQGYETLQNTELAEYEKEEERLLYVALTRARDYIFMPIAFYSNGTRMNNLCKNWFDLRSACMQRLESRNLIQNIQEIKRPEIIRSKNRENSNVFSFSDLQKRMAKPGQERETKFYKKFISYSNLHVSKEQKTPKKQNETNYQNAASTDYRIGAKFGILCHSVLENFSLDLIKNPTKLSKEIKNLCELEFRKSGIMYDDEKYNEKLAYELCLQAVQSKYPTENEISSPQDWERILREKKFLEKGESLGDYLLGVGDLFFYYKGKYYILDWKTDIDKVNLTEDELRNYTLDSYKHQLYIYSWVIAKNLQSIYNGEAKEVFDKHYGGMIYVYLRNFQEGIASIRIKPTYEEINLFIHQKRLEKSA